MKIAPLLVASASALETSTSANALLAAIGRRNVTHMESLIQGLAQESVSEPGWKFDKDIQDALHAINDMFVKNIQAALEEQHKVDQEAHNCETKECFEGCDTSYSGKRQKNAKSKADCDVQKTGHEQCRAAVYQAYKTMGKACAALHCFQPPVPNCETEDCICPDVATCHRKTGDAVTCEADSTTCKSQTYKSWLDKVIIEFDTKHKHWQQLYAECTYTYQQFLKLDIQCDAQQKSFETCRCQVEYSEKTSCEVEFKNCNDACWAKYEENVPKLQCLETDRKIDWSATKKIECYLDVLLHEYTKEDLLAKCGSEDCINKAREEDYKACSHVCPNVDHEGSWSQPTCTDDGAVTLTGHGLRHHHDEYHLGDGTFKCDMNGASVHTNHRGGVDRQKEHRCTEHLDIDFQIPPWRECPGCDPKVESCNVCDNMFLCENYQQFDNTKAITCYTDCCPENGNAPCFNPTTISSCAGVGAANKRTITFGEHTDAWANNRCECTSCPHGVPQYPTPEHGRMKCAGAHSM